MLSQRIWRWLKWHDGSNVLLADKSEAGWYNIPDRGFDVEQNTRHGEYNPEHVHHNYLHSDVYAQSREARGVQGSAPNNFLQKGKFSDEPKWLLSFNQINFFEKYLLFLKRKKKN